MSIVICKLPKAGLGNQLFPLMHAQLFAKLNDLPIIITGYHQLKLGPYLRKEKSKRRYSGYFNFQKNVAGEYLDRLRAAIALRKYFIIREPDIKSFKPADLHGKVFIFEKLPTYHNYFGRLNTQRDEVKKILFAILNPWIKKKIEDSATPVIGVHIRMGDFRKLNPGESFKGGHVRTPEDYFVNIISAIRKIHGTKLPVSVFTDGYRQEFETLFSLENVEMIEGNSDIVDLLLLGRAKIIVSSTGSTFSYWAGFLSDATLIMHADHIYESVRLKQNESDPYEGAFIEGNEQLRQDIRQIKW